MAVFNTAEYDLGYIPFNTPYNVDYLPADEAYQVDADEVEVFKDLLRILQSKQVVVIFLMTPEYGLTEVDYDRMESMKILNSIALENDISFLNYNTALKSSINEDISLFSDWGHLNGAGSRIFSDSLKVQLDLLITSNEANSN